MLEENLIKIYERSFRENREMSALTDYFKGETFSYYEMAKEIAKLHLLYKKAGIRQGSSPSCRTSPRPTSSTSSTTPKAGCCSWATTSGT